MVVYYVMTGMAVAADFEFYRLSAYAKSLVPIERQLYLEKLSKLGCDDPYLFPPDVWKSTQLPNIDEHDVFRHLIAKHSKKTGFELRAYKAIRDAEEYVHGRWVKDVFGAKLNNGVTIVSTIRVTHSQGIRKTMLNLWSAIARDSSIISSRCDCVAG